MSHSYTRRSVLAGSAAWAASRLAPAQSSPQRPNLLFFFPDQHRFDWTGLNPSMAVRTPNLNALAARGVEFTRAIVASPVCAPSRACLASGKEYDRCGVRNNGDNYPVDQATYYGMLREAGYHVAVCGKVDLHKATLDWGLDGSRLLSEWGFSAGIDNAGKFDAIKSGANKPKDPYMAFLHRRELAAAHVDDFSWRTGPNGYRNTAPTPLPEDAYCDNWVAANGLKLLREAPKGKPWHLVLNFTGPHNPVDITSRMDGICRGREFPQPFGSTEFDEGTHVKIRQNYSAMVENIDRWLGTLLEEVKRRGELDNTVVIFCSDHGEMLGDHNRWGKSVPYQPSIGVPLVAAGPGVEGGRRSNALVSHIDLAATFLDFAGQSIPKDMDSRSLRALLAGKATTHREFLRSGLDNWRLVTDGRYKLIRGFDPAAKGKKVKTPLRAPEILFDLQEDPAESRDIAAQAPDHAARLSRLLV